ncbi:MAG: DUF732 domain-containing protein [Mycobacterium sp.]|uniref:DUF732 domain-containing protein n=1 Tax=Mycobacterium sp. TaxID=1785 RepID=UPI001EBA2445|nr:DUF732 domain-containing protein [Mycobacterium sp.]MBW0018382.1 DUF732 domain-containing protein [Mycobacterium sp.]
MRLVLALASFGVATGAVFGTAAPAKADLDSTDQAFLVTLRQAGVTYQDPESAIRAGKTVCSLVASGMSGADVVKSLQDNNPGFQGDGAGKFAAIAAEAYCPKAITDGGVPGPKPDGV